MCALGAVTEHGLCSELSCCHCCRAKPKKVEDEPAPAPRRSMRLLRVEPIDIPLVESLAPPAAEEYVRWEGVHSSFLKTLL